MIHIDNTLIDNNVEIARNNPRKRINHNFHTDLSDTLQRLLNSIEPSSYCRPHKHSFQAKREVFIILRGSAVVVEFDNSGEISDYLILKPGTGEYGAEIPPHTWHTIISLESGTVVFECKDGPYSGKTDKDFASWAPEEGSPESAAYIEGILKKLKL